MATRVKEWVERRFGIVLALAFGVGLAVPILERVPSTALIFILAFVIFLSSFRIRAAELRSINVNRLVVFYLVRFVLLPILFLFVGRLGFRDEAIGLFLLAMMPAGVSSPAFAGLMGGNVALALVLVVLSTLLAPVVVPTAFAAFTAQIVLIDTWALFVTLILTVFVPILAHLPLRNVPSVSERIRKYGSAVSILCIALTIVLVVAKRRESFLSFGPDVWRALAFSFAAYAIFYVVGHLIPKSSRHDNISLAMCSGANNVALGISLALMYFPPGVAVFMVICEIPWTAAILPYRWWLDWSKIEK